MRPAAPARLAYASLALALASSAPARVGETQEEFERRLFQPSVGKFMPRDKNPDPFREAELAKQQPFNAARPYFPDDLRERRYWKSAVPGMLSSDNGWRIHVFYQGSVSVLEAYERAGDSLSSFEIELILRANQGSSEWKKIEADSLEAKGSAIGCDYELADGSLRAKVSGNWIMLFSTRLDAHVKERIRSLQEEQTRNMDERTRARQLAAPGSTAGF